jgi:DnaJ-class molecular chaperone
MRYESRVMNDTAAVIQHSVTCPVCRGVGQITSPPSKGYVVITYPCSRCSGTGLVYVTDLRDERAWR